MTDPRKHPRATRIIKESGALLHTNKVQLGLNMALELHNRSGILLVVLAGDLTVIAQCQSGSLRKKCRRRGWCDVSDPADPVDRHGETIPATESGGAKLVQCRCGVPANRDSLEMRLILG